MCLCLKTLRLGLMLEKCEADISFVFLLCIWINSWYCCCVTVTDYNVWSKSSGGKCDSTTEKIILDKKCFSRGSKQLPDFSNHVIKIKCVVQNYVCCLLWCEEVWKIVNPIKSPKWHLATQFFHFESLMCECFTIRMFVKIYLHCPVKRKYIIHSVYSSRLVIRHQI